MKIHTQLNRALAVLCLAISGAMNVAALAGTITNSTAADEIWIDTAGNEIVANGGNVLLVDGTFHWYGWNKYAKTVVCYTSATLASDGWTKQFSMFGSGFHGRPDVIKHPTSGTYVMIVECSTPNEDGRNGIQYYTASDPLGPFVLQLQENQVLKNNEGELVSMGDKGIYQDDDGTAYIICAADDGNLTSGANDTHKIIRLKPDYIGQEALVQSWGPVTKNRREAIAIFKRNGTYYMTSSGTHGWNSGATWYKTATAIDGTWSDWANVPTSPFSGNSFNTQHDFILTITGTSATSYIYLGDRWSQDTGVGFGRNAWFPLTFDAGGVPTIQGHDVWSIDPATGVIEVESNPPPPSDINTLVFTPTKDAMIKEATPTTNFGTAMQLQVSGQPGFRKTMFVEFAVSGIPAGAVVANVSLLFTSKTTVEDRPIAAHAVSNSTWLENGIRWNNAPPLGTTLATVTSHIADEDSVWDVTAHVGANGVFAFGIDASVSGDTNFHSRESGPGNSPSLVITYEIPDTTPPILQLPSDIELEATESEGAVAVFDATAEDAVDGPVPVILSAQSGETFPFGTTTVTASATDAAGNTATGAFTVTVIDSTAPAFTSLTASPAMLWPPNHKLVPITLNAVLADAVDPSPALRIASVTSNEPVNGPVATLLQKSSLLLPWTTDLGDGNFGEDWEITGDLTLKLRAERAGGGSGRIYTITVEARDDSDNASTRTVQIVVPHNKP